MRQSFDPLSFIPSAEAIRKNLATAKAVVKRWHLLLRVAEQIEATSGNQSDQGDGSLGLSESNSPGGDK